MVRPVMSLSRASSLGSSSMVGHLKPSRRGPQLLSWFEDAGLLLLLVLAFPLVVLVVGTPMALVVRLLIEISRRW
jgi:hypothetical protein